MTSRSAMTTSKQEDAQCVVSSGTCCLYEGSPEPKKQCTGERYSSPPLFSSPSEFEASETSDGALFPSDHSIESSASSNARYPSEDVDSFSQAHDDEQRSIPVEPISLSTDDQGLVTDSNTENVASSMVELITDSNTENVASSMVKLTTPYDVGDEEREQVGKLLVSGCCQRQCLLHLTARDVLTARKKYFLRRGNEQRQWLVDRVHENSHEEEKGKLSVKFSVAGREVCQSAWCQIYVISHRRIARIVKSVSHGRLVAEHGNKGKRRSNTKSETAKAWMTRYFNLL